MDSVHIPGRQANIQWVLLVSSSDKNSLYNKIKNVSANIKIKKRTAARQKN